MAGGIDWFRWHHGSVTDPKFQLIARKAGASLPDVLAVWAFILEQASAASERGQFSIDAEAVDCMFNFPATETRTADVLKAMQERGLLDGCAIVAWEKRQPKREREDDTSAARKAAQRERDAANVTPHQASDANVTPCHTTSHQQTPRGEERREEKEQATSLRSVAASPKRHSRKCPASFEITPALIDWASENAPGVNLKTETDKLRDYTFKTPYSDWEGAWRNWIRRAAENLPKARALPESFRERDDRLARERVAEFAPGVAAKAPGAPPHRFDFIDMENSNVFALEST